MYARAPSKPPVCVAGGAFAASAAIWSADGCGTDDCVVAGAEFATGVLGVALWQPPIASRMIAPTVTLTERAFFNGVEKNLTASFVSQVEGESQCETHPYGFRGIGRGFECRS